jgi:hypothetical protein
MFHKIVFPYVWLAVALGITGVACSSPVPPTSGPDRSSGGSAATGGGPADSGVGGQGGAGQGGAGQGGAGQGGAGQGGAGQGGAGQGGAGQGGAGPDASRPDSGGSDGAAGAGAGGTSPGRDGGGLDVRGADGSDTHTRDAGSIVDAASDVSGGDVAPPPPGRFRHPGVLLNQKQLDFVRDKVLAGAEPWKAGYERARTSSFASLSWVPKARAIVECGSSSNPNFGCSDERDDALAAYTHALLWHMSGNPAHAQKAVEILNAWGGLLQSHINSNAPLQAGWSGAAFARAAEIIRYTGGGWAPADIDRFSAMLRTAFVPLVNVNSSKNGNWELIMIDASIGIGVFNDDSAVFDKAVSMWRRRVPAYVYLTSDGPYPVPPPVGGRDTPAELIAFWQGQSTFVDGLAQETCRDLGHTSWGIAAAINAAETALQQGIDLYAEESPRLRAGLEFHADYLNGKPAPDWLCGGMLTLGTIPTGEIAYNHFYNRLGIPLPLTKTLLETKVRPAGSNYFIAWETLTHADVGWMGIK